MRHSQLRAFHQVAVSGGFSRAAEVLNQTQPSLSDHVRKLEQQYDVLLFERDRRQVSLTKAGEALLRLTKQYFEVEDQIRDHLGASRSAITGRLRIVADSAHHITGALGRFRAAHPGVFVELRVGNTRAVLEALRNYDAEIGVIGTLDATPDLEMVDLGTTPIVAIAAKGFLPSGVDQIAFADLQNYPLIFRESGSRTRAALEAAARDLRLNLRPALEVEGREATREVVAAGAGLGFVSEAEFGQDSRIIPVPLTGANLHMSERLIYLGQRREIPVIRAFLNSVKEG